MASNEKEIRALLKSWLETKYKGTVLDEFTGGTMKTRPDVVCFTDDKIIMCEIKSDKDSLARLRTQVEDYLKHSNKVYVALDIIHIKAFDKHMKDEGFQNLMNSDYVDITWFKDGVLQQRINEDEFCSTNNHKSSMRWYKPISVEILYGFLWNAEVQSLVYFLKGRSKLSFSNRITYWGAVERIYTIFELRTLIQEILQDRIQKLSHDRKWKRGFDGGKFKSEIRDIPGKQALFDQYISSYSTKKI